MKTWLIVVSFAAIASASESEFFSPLAMGYIQEVGTNEISGIVPMTGHDGYFWVHNDSHHLPNERIFAIHQSGFVVAEVWITGASKGDWEDIAIGPGPEPDVRYIYISDTGTNVVAERTLSIWRVPEPQLPSLDPGQLLDSQEAYRIVIRYPSGIRNVEALTLDPAAGTLYLLSKQANVSEVYRVPDVPGGDGVYELVLLGSFAVPHPHTDADAVTGADASVNGTQLLVRTYTQILLFERSPEDPFESIFSGVYRVVPSPSEPQGEAITWDQEGRDYLTVSEGVSAPVYRMFRKIPQEHCVPQPDDHRPLTFLRGDVADEDSDEKVNVTDAAALLEMVRAGGADDCADSADITDDGVVDLTDVETLLTSLARGTRLPQPFPEVGLDPTPDELRCLEGGALDLVPESAEYAYWYAAEPPEASWKDPGAELPDWPRGAGGIGFGSALLGTPLEGSPDLSPTLYAHCEFSLADPSEFAHLVLEADYAHGFVAYLNGTEVARGRLLQSGFAVPADLPASSIHRGGTAEEYLVCSEVLQEGVNALALEVHGHGPTPEPELFFRSRLRGFLHAEDPTVDPPPETQAEARFYCEHDGPLSIDGEGTIRVMLDSSSPVRALSVSLAYDREHLAVGGIDPADWLTEGALWASYVRVSSRNAALALLVDPDVFEGGVLPPGEGIPIADVHYRITATECVQTQIPFSERTGTLGLRTVLSIPEAGTFVPATTDFLAAVVQPFMRSDSNDDGNTGLADAIFTFSYLFASGPPPPCLEAADANDDGEVDLADGIYIIQHVFAGGPAIPPPYPECGVDPTEGIGLGCERYHHCAVR